MTDHVPGVGAFGFELVHRLVTEYPEMDRVGSVVHTELRSPVTLACPVACLGLPTMPYGLLMRPPTDRVDPPATIADLLTLLDDGRLTLIPGIGPRFIEEIQVRLLHAGIDLQSPEAGAVPSWSGLAPAGTVPELPHAVLHTAVSRTCPIRCLRLSESTYRYLRRAGVDTVQQVIGLCLDGTLGDVRGIGVTRISEIREALSNLGLWRNDRHEDSAP